MVENLNSQDFLKEGNIDKYIHYYPVFLGLVCLTLSLSGNTVFEGFEEWQPGTWLSLVQLFLVLMMTIPVIRNTEQSQKLRNAAKLITGVTILAILDEYNEGHENVGYFVQDRFYYLPKEILTYTDDILIIIGAILGSIILYYMVKNISFKTEYYPYLIWILFLAIGHGILDVFGHEHYALKLLFPQATLGNTMELREVISYFEETFKLWTEWSVILFLLKLFYNREGFLGWSILIFMGMILAPFGLWRVIDPDLGVVYFNTGTSFQTVRNFPMLIILAIIWITWANAIYKPIKENVLPRWVAGLHFILPYYYLLPQQGRILLPDPVTYNDISLSFFLSIIVVLSIALFSYYKTRNLKYLLIILVIPIFEQFKVSGLWVQPLHLIALTGIFLLPIFAGFKNKYYSLENILVLAGFIFIQHTIALALLVNYTIYRVVIGNDIKKYFKNRFIIGWVVLQLIISLIILNSSKNVFIPNIDTYDFEEERVYHIGYQKVEKPKIRMDSVIRKKQSLPL